MDITLIKLKNSNFDDVKNIVINSLDYYETVENIILSKVTEEYINQKVQDILIEYSKKETYTNEYILGVLYNKKIIGIVKYLTNFLKESQVMLGLFLIDKNYRHKEIGKFVFIQVINLVKKENQKYIRIGVDKKNIKALKFWHKLGFKYDSTKNYDYGNCPTIFFILTKEI